MHWFDDFVRGLAGESVTRRVALGSAGIASGSIAAWAALPHRAFASEAPAGSRLRTQQLAGGVAPKTIAPAPATHGIVRARATLPGSFSSGPCTYKRADRNDEMRYVATSTANGQTVTLTVERRVHFEPDGSHLSATSTNSIDVMADGARIVRLENTVTSSRAGETPKGTATLSYGSAVRGARGATFAVEGKAVRAAVEGAEPLTPGGRGKIVPARLGENGAHVDLAIDENLLSAIGTLFDRYKSEHRTCNGIPPLRRRASRRGQSRGAFLSGAVARRQGYIVADAPAESSYGGAAGVETQNQYGAPSTPHCNSCMNAAASQMEGCWESLGIDLLFGCPECLVAVIQCQFEATAAAVGCWLPGAGCGEVICGVGTSCDSGDSCCGSDCCTGNDVCLAGSTTCCPPGYASSCVGPSGFPFCCGKDESCCGNDLCCPSGSNCCGGKFCCESVNACCGSVCCDTGYVCADAATSFCCPEKFGTCGTVCCNAQCRNGQCCTSFCGNDCCGPNEFCDASGTRCVPGSFGTPKPQPSRRRSLLCIAGGVACVASNYDGTTTEVCCSPKVTCCAGKCCAPGQQCGGPEQYFGCGVWIR